MDASQQRHILLTSVGTNGPKVTRYARGDMFATSSFSAYGLWQLLPEENRPDEIWFLMTPKAQDSAWAAIQEEAASLSVTVKPIELLGNTDDTREFLEQTAQQIPEGCRLTLNVTEGLRHHAFLFYALALYLTTFRKVKISGAWYCRLETDGGDDPKPLIDLKPVLELAQWFHALAVFQEQGLASPIAKLLRPEVEQLRAEARLLKNDPAIHRRATELEKYAKAFENHAFTYAAGLPLELGKASRALSDRIHDFLGSEQGKKLPLSGSLAEIISQTAEKTAFAEAVPASGKWKETIELNEWELERQSRMIDSYLDRGQVSQATGLMREWVISWLMWKNGETKNWLGYSARKPFEQKLGSLGALAKANVGDLDIALTDEQKGFASFWSQLSDSLRNALLHHGMRPEHMDDRPPALESVCHYWGRLKLDNVELGDAGGGSGRLLICPIGMTPGVLYSAIKQTNPARLLVICSRESECAIDEAIEKSGYQTDVRRLIMDNAFTGIAEFNCLITNASRWLFESDEIQANLTGGTTLMGVLVTRLVQRAQREYQRPVREFVLIDPRSPEQQRDDPWQLGDIHYLDDDKAEPDEGPAVPIEYKEADEDGECEETKDGDVANQEKNS